MCRLMSLVCSHHVEFTKAAPYIAADYCTTVQHVTLYPPVKVCISFISVFHASTHSDIMLLILFRFDMLRCKIQISQVVKGGAYTICVAPDISQDSLPVLFHSHGSGRNEIMVPCGHSLPFRPVLQH